MKKILLILFALALTACAQYSYTLTQTPVKLYSLHQMDSVCVAEKIPTLSSNKWLQTYMMMYENNKVLYQYVYIQRQNNKEKTYMCTYMDSIYKYNTRYFEKIKK